MNGEQRPRTKVLAVDDNREALFALERALERHGYEVVGASTGLEALASAREARPDVILLDVVMPDIDGYRITKILKEDPVLRYTPLLLLTGKGEYDEIAHGLDQGADGYVTKPFQLTELLARIKAALRTQELYRELHAVSTRNELLERQLVDRYSFSNIIGGSAKMREVYDLIGKVAKAHVPILVTGESGTGKELVAKAIHYNSDRKGQPFVVQNCSAFQESLLESELFGHLKGSFTGAVKDKPGLFQQANKGTFFLDELGEMSMALQAKLLRVLQDGTFTPVGDTRQRQVDVRVVGATHRDLPTMIAAGTFREDLYYRLNVVTIALPPLRERREDIPLLVAHFLDRAATRRGRGRRELPKETLRYLVDYSWPGNIRQLENEIERLLLMAGDDAPLAPDLLSIAVRGEGTRPKSDGEEVVPPGRGLKDAVEDLERVMILGALSRAGGNKSEAARELGISRSNLIAKVQSYRLGEGSDEGGEGR